MSRFHPIYYWLCNGWGKCYSYEMQLGEVGPTQHSVFPVHWGHHNIIYVEPAGVATVSGVDPPAPSQIEPRVGDDAHISVSVSTFIVETFSCSWCSNPNSPEPGVVSWPRYAEDRRHYLELRGPSQFSVCDKFREEYCEFWRSINRQARPDEDTWLTWKRDAKKLKYLCLVISIILMFGCSSIARRLGAVGGGGGGEGRVDGVNPLHKFSWILACSMEPRRL